MRRGGRRDGEDGGKQRVLVAPRGEGPEQLTSVCVFSVGVGVKRSVRVRLAELVLLPPPRELLRRGESTTWLPAPTKTRGPDRKPGRNSSSLGGLNSQLVKKIK